MTFRPILPALLAAVLLGAAPARAQDAAAPAAPGTFQPVPAETPPSAPADKGMTMLTIFLRHDESRPLGDINAQLARQHYFETFPPRGVEIVSWYVMMGIGQVVTLRFPAERLREVNRAIEGTAWGPYRTEFYPTYDYKPSALAERRAH